MVRRRDCRPLEAESINAGQLSFSFSAWLEKLTEPSVRRGAEILLTATRGVEVTASGLATALRIPSTLIAILQRYRNASAQSGSCGPSAVWASRRTAAGIHRIQVVRGQGDGALALIDRTGRKIGDMAVDAHPDRFSLRRSGRVSS
jgi:hypothetical protein